MSGQGKSAKLQATVQKAIAMDKFKKAAGSGTGNECLFTFLLIELFLVYLLYNFIF